jgi:hypothetical protein
VGLLPRQAVRSIGCEAAVGRTLVTWDALDARLFVPIEAE